MKLEPKSELSLRHARGLESKDPTLKLITRRDGGGFLHDVINGPEWSLYVQRLKLELPRREEELSELREEYELRQAESQGLPEHYIANLPA